VVRDASTGKLVRRFEHGPHGSVTAYCLTDDGRTLVAEHSKRVSSEAVDKLEAIVTGRVSARLWDFAAGRDLGEVGRGVEVRYREIFNKGSIPLGKDYPVGAWLREVGAVAHGCGVRVSATGRIMVFPRFPRGAALEVARCGKGESLCLRDRATGRELHRFTELAVGTQQGFGLSEDGNTLAASGGIDGKSVLLVWDVSRWQREAVKPGPELSTDELNALWLQLGQEETLQAYKAMRRLAASPRQALAFLRDRLQPAADRKEDITAWVSQLDHARFAVRQKAEAALLAVGEEAVPQLREALKAPPSAEARMRLESLLTKIQQARVPDPVTRRLLWSVELLAQLGSPQARQLLDRLARGSPDAWVTREAKAARHRLKAP
jgi:hypothetical protein